jgi:hypothetical protein
MQADNGVFSAIPTALSFMLRVYFQLLSFARFLRRTFTVHCAAPFAHRDGLRRRPAQSPLSQALYLAVCAAALTACSPTYDWRTIMNNDEGYTVDLPAKPSLDERQIEVDGTPMKMAMQTAEAGDAVFAVGTVMLPNDDPQTQRATLEFLRAGLARNLGVTPDAHAAPVPLAAGGDVPGFDVTFSGVAGPQKEARVMHARLVAKGRHVYQAAVVAKKELPPEQLDQFFESFKLY